MLSFSGKRGAFFASDALLQECDKPRSATILPGSLSARWWRQPQTLNTNLEHKFCENNSSNFQAIKSETANSAAHLLLNFRRPLSLLREVPRNLFTMVEFPRRRYSLRTVLDLGGLRHRTETKMDLSHLHRLCAFHLLSRIRPALESAAAGGLSPHAVWRCLVRFIIRLERFSRLLYRWIDRIYCLEAAGGSAPN